MTELTVSVDGKPVSLRIEAKTCICDLACELEEKGYKVNVAHPNCSVEGKRMNGFDKVQENLQYNFSK